MKKFPLVIVFITTAFVARAQSTHDIMLGGGVDFLKTDIRSALNKAQLGLEGNYFIKRRIALGVGTELWMNNQKSSLMLGTRLYANDKVFFRVRGLIGANDLSIGMGYSKPIDKNLRLEGMGDYYFAGSAFALRIGLGYILK